MHRFALLLVLLSAIPAAAGNAINQVNSLYVDPPTLATAINTTDCAIFPAADVPQNQAKCSVRLATTLMAGLPVVASAVGGIKEVVVHGETGYLVPLKQQSESPFEPSDPEQFSRDLAERINELMANPALREQFGRAGRARVVEKFSWTSIAMQTRNLYASLSKK